MKTVLTIAGSDCGGAGGIQSDIKTITAHRLYATSAITAMTAQNTTGVYDIQESTTKFLGRQLDCIFEDIYPDAVKIGMVSNEELIEVIADKLKQYKAANIVLDTSIVSSSGRRMVGNKSEMIITSVHIDIVLDIIRGESGRKADLPYGLEVYREYGKIGIAKRKKQEKDGQICIDCNMEGEDGKKIRCDRGAFFIKKIKNMPANRKIQEKMYTKWMDYDILKSTFQIRTRRPGDYIVVNQEGGRKKLKDYFIDLKIPREERDRILLVAEGSEVFWVVGYRISERVRITEKTGSMLQIEYIPAVAGI